MVVTGHTGFKGAWLAALLEHLGATVTGLALAPETPTTGVFAALSPGWSVTTDLVDICDGERLAAAMAGARPEVVFHLAAQALVRRGFADPVGTYRTNVVGTANVLAATCPLPDARAVVVVTSDKVYANDEQGRPFTESDPLGGKDPYSSSKACAELVVKAWRASFLARRRADDGSDVAVATARAGNVIGGGDHGEARLVPDVFRALSAGCTLRLRYPRSTRPWQFVLDPLWGYVRYAEFLLTDPTATPPSLNFGPLPESSTSVVDVVERLFGLWGATDATWALDEAAGGGPEAGTLVLDSSLARRILGWSPQIDLDTALQWTCDWARREQAGDRAALADPGRRADRTLRRRRPPGGGRWSRCRRRRCRRRRQPTGPPQPVAEQVHRELPARVGADVGQALLPHLGQDVELVDLEPEALGLDHHLGVEEPALRLEPHGFQGQRGAGSWGCR